MEIDSPRPASPGQVEHAVDQSPSAPASTASTALHPSAQPTSMSPLERAPAAESPMDAPAVNATGPLGTVSPTDPQTQPADTNRGVSPRSHTPRDAMIVDGTPASAASVLTNGTHIPDSHDDAMNGSEAESSTSGAPSFATADQAEDDDMDRFLKRMDMEKKIAQLQQRLELASFKTNNGWSDMSINEIETRLPSQRRPQVVVPGGRGATYEPPSPSRPWQLADVLWQPLPQPNGHPAGPSGPQPGYRPAHMGHTPSHSLPGGLPSIASLQMPVGPSHRGPPASPRRHRMDDYLSRPTVSPLRGPQRNGHANGHANGRPPSQGHRRASSSVSSLPFLNADPYPTSPLRPPKKTKKRSQSHSNLRERPPTDQDVDAARALTSMLESARSPTTPTHTHIPSMKDLPSAPGPRLPPLHSTASFPPPFAGDMPPPRPRAQSFAAEPREPHEHARVSPMAMGPPGLRTPSSHTRGRGQSMDSSATFRGNFWRAHPDNDREREREREARERDRQRERERDRAAQAQRGEEEGMAGRAEEDKTAVELMMFLAHSPSPVRKRPASDVPAAGFGATARVLFADHEREPAPGPRPAPPSGLPAPRRLNEPVARH